MLSVIRVYVIVLSVVLLSIMVPQERLAETKELGYCDSKLITEVKSLIV